MSIISLSSNDTRQLDLLVQLQHVLSTEIPISQAMGITPAAFDNGSLVLTAPLQPNINHKDTVFAGSLNALVTLAGWSLCWLLLRERALLGNIVIQDSTIKYLRPVTGAFAARCVQPAQAEIERCANTLRRRGRARIELYADIHERGALAVAFTGRYVVTQ